MEFTKKNVIKSIKHFILGKALSSVIGLVLMYQIVSNLTVEEYATYSILISFVEVVTALSGFGLAHIVIRFIPELYSLNLFATLRAFIFKVIVYRTYLLISFCIIAYLISPAIIVNIGLIRKEYVFRIYLLVVFFRSLNNSFSNILESTLHQSYSQLGFGAVSIIRLISILLLNHNNSVNLITLILTEIIAEIVGVVVQALFIKKVHANQDCELVQDDCSWIEQNKKRLYEYAKYGYIQHLTILPYGAFNRPLAGHYLSYNAMAAYGLVLTISEYFRRYLPSQLLLNVIRPYILAEYSRTNNIQQVWKRTNDVLCINLIIISYILLVMIFYGNHLISLYSSNKITVGVCLLLVFSLMQLIFESQRQQIEILVQVTEKYNYLIPANILLSLSIFISCYAIPIYGASAIIILNILGLVVSNFYVLFMLHFSGYYFNYKKLMFVKIIIIFTLNYFIFHFLLGKLSLFYGIPLLLLLFCLVTYFMFFNLINEISSYSKARSL